MHGTALSTPISGPPVKSAPPLPACGDRCGGRLTAPPIAIRQFCRNRTEAELPDDGVDVTA